MPGIGGSAELEFRRDEIVNGQCGLFNFAHIPQDIGTVYYFLFQKHTLGDHRPLYRLQATESLEPDVQ